jgi:hypothetical protein
VRGTLDEQLQSAADKSGRSVSEEIEFRLEESFRSAETIEQMLGGPHTAAMLKMFAGAIGLVEARHGHRWDKTETSKVETRVALTFLLGELTRVSGESHFGAISEVLTGEVEDRLARDHPDAAKNILSVFKIVESVLSEHKPDKP